MNAPRGDPDGAAARALAATNHVLAAAYEGHPAIVVRAPAGAGKSELVLALAAQAAGVFRERCCVATYTNAQAEDLAGRLLRRYGRISVTLLVRQGRALSAELRRHPRLRVARLAADLPRDPSVVIANTAKLSASAIGPEWFGSLVVDESYQVAERLFAPVATLTRTLIMVGDPGQTAPVVTSPVTRWAHDPAGPHVAAPIALLARHPEVPTLSLPVSRRLTADMTGLLQPHVYPDLPFESLTPPAGRYLGLRRPGRFHALDRALDLAAGGAGLVMVELREAEPVSVDPEVADTIVALLRRLLDRGALVVTQGGASALSARHLGVVCAHREQVQAIQARLVADLVEVRAETADRWQGLEAPVVIAWHPLTGPRHLRAFHVDLGRACVMFTRANTVTFIVGRAAIGERLRGFTLDQPPPLGIERNPAYEGLLAHRGIDRGLRAAGRVVEVT